MGIPNKDVAMAKYTLSTKVFARKMNLVGKNFFQLIQKALEPAISNSLLLQAWPKLLGASQGHTRSKFGRIYISILKAIKIKKKINAVEFINLGMNRSEKSKSNIWKK